VILDDILSQKEAKEYVLNKPIIRPKTTIKSLVLFLLKICILGTCFGGIALLIVNLYVELIAALSILIIVGNIVVVFMFSLKKLSIICVECYQHYAPEEYRRLCLCKPTCSEYALMVLKKYIFIKAIYLIHIRLRKTCKNTYKIDFP